MSPRAIRAAALVLAAALGLCGVAGSEEERVMTLSDLGIDAAPAPPAPPAIIIAPAPADPSPIAVHVDPLIYNEDGSLYTGPMPDGTYCVNGRIATVIDPPAYDDADDAAGAVILDAPGFYFHYGFIDPDIERYWGDHIRFPGDSRWDLYRYRPERRPLPSHRPDRYRDRPRRSGGSVRSRPDGPPRARPEGPRPPRPHEIGRPTGPRGGRDPGSRLSRPDRPRRPRR